MFQMHYEARGLLLLTHQHANNTLRSARWSSSQSERALLTKQLSSVFRINMYKLPRFTEHSLSNQGLLGKEHEIPHGGGWPQWL